MEFMMLFHTGHDIPIFESPIFASLRIWSSVQYWKRVRQDLWYLFDAYDVTKVENVINKRREVCGLPVDVEHIGVWLNRVSMDKCFSRKSISPVSNSCFLHDKSLIDFNKLPISCPRVAYRGTTLRTARSLSAVNFGPCGMKVLFLVVMFADASSDWIGFPRKNNIGFTLIAIRQVWVADGLFPKHPYTYAIWISMSPENIYICIHTSLYTYIQIYT